MKTFNKLIKVLIVLVLSPILIVLFNCTRDTCYYDCGRTTICDMIADDEDGDKIYEVTCCDGECDGQCAGVYNTK